MVCQRKTVFQQVFFITTGKLLQCSFSPITAGVTCIDAGFFQMAQNIYGFRKIKLIHLLFKTKNFKIGRQARK